MKTLTTIFFAIGMITMSSTSVAAMSKSRVRTEARFLTDKMAYELSLNVGQRNDAYEINYDFIYSVRNLMDDVLRGEEWAMNRYYYLLDLRNDDLRWIMNSNQYQRFMMIDYFYRPIYTSGNRWSFRIYINYANPNFFYFDRPYHYSTYVYRNYRSNHSTPSFYRGRYNHTVYSRPGSVRDRNVYDNNRRSDFSSVRVRPNTSTPPRVSESSKNNRLNTSSSSRSNVNNSSRSNASNSKRTPAVNNNENKKNSPVATRPLTSTSSSRISGTTSSSSSSSSKSSASNRSQGETDSSVKKSTPSTKSAPSKDNASSRKSVSNKESKSSSVSSSSNRSTNSRSTTGSRSSSNSGSNSGRSSGSSRSTSR